jgi:hypothetical protein
MSYLNICNYDDFKKITENIKNISFSLVSDSDLEKEYLIPNHISIISVNYSIPPNIIFNKGLQELTLILDENKQKKYIFPDIFNKLKIIISGFIPKNIIFPKSISHIQLGMGIHVKYRLNNKETIIDNFYMPDNFVFHNILNICSRLDNLEEKHLRMEILEEQNKKLSNQLLDIQTKYDNLNKLVERLIQENNKSCQFDL